MDDARRRPRSLALLALLLCAILLPGACAAPGTSRDPGSFRRADEPAEPGRHRPHTVRIDDLERAWTTYVPADLNEPAAVLLLFHGSGDTAAGIRGWVGQHFERIADDNGVIIAYPNGFRNNWNECRREGRWPAKDRDLDDVGFARAIVDRLERDLGPGAVDRDRIFAAGYSSGGHMAMRLGREADDLIGGIAVVAANPPTADNQRCADQETPMPVLFVQGVRDGINPFDGGEVRVFGPGSSRGNVMSAMAGAQWYADVNGASGPRPAPSPAGVRITEWNGAHPVRLVAVETEGHNFPVSSHNAPREIWEFLSRTAG